MASGVPVDRKGRDDEDNNGLDYILSHTHSDTGSQGRRRDKSCSLHNNAHSEINHHSFSGTTPPSHYHYHHHTVQHGSPIIASISSGIHKPTGTHKREVKFALDVADWKRSAEARIQEADHVHTSGLRRIRDGYRILRSVSMEHVGISEDITKDNEPKAFIPPEVESSDTMEPSDEGLEDIIHFARESLYSFSYSDANEKNTKGNKKRTLSFVQNSLSLNNSFKALSVTPSTLDIEGLSDKIKENQDHDEVVDLLRKANLLPLSNDNSSNATDTQNRKNTSDDHSNSIHEKYETIKHQFDSDKSNPLTLKIPAALNDLDSGTSTRSPSPSTAEDYQPSSSYINSPIVTGAGISRRNTLKRTLTDVTPLTIQQKLFDAMSKPFAFVPSNKNDKNGRQMAAIFHAIPTRYAGSSRQMILTTTVDQPWTIMSANDMSLLYLGIVPDQMEKLSMLDLISPTRREWIQSVLEEANDPKHDDPNDLSLYATSASNKVILCGRVIPVQRITNDSEQVSYSTEAGAVSLWLKRKMEGLIWVMEEVPEYVSFIEYSTVSDPDNNIIKGQILRDWGDTSEIFSSSSLSVMAQYPIARYLPTLSDGNGCLDLEKLDETFHWSSKSILDYNVPSHVTCLTPPEELSNTKIIRISALKNMAGIVVISALEHEIISFNPTFFDKLFGYSNPTGMHITKILPAFEKIIKFLEDEAFENGMQLSEGTIIPEHAFRRADAMVDLGMKSSMSDTQHHRHLYSDSTDAGQSSSPSLSRQSSITSHSGSVVANMPMQVQASLLIEPHGLEGRHRDGSSIDIDVQMRIVRQMARKSDHRFESNAGRPSQLMYALWFTYTRENALIAPSRRPSDTSLFRPRKSVRIPSKLSEDIGTAEDTEEKKDELQINKYDILEDLGQGAYGSVKLASRKTDDNKVVLKFITKTRILIDTWIKDKELGTVPLEIHVLNYLKSKPHKNIVEMLEWFEDQQYYYIAMEPHYPGMDLFDYIELQQNMTEAEAQSIFLQVSRAIYHLHTLGIAHRDIKDENVVLDQDGWVQLIDFGSAVYVKDGPFDTFHGTLDYAPPEVLAGKKYNGKEQDVWAAGILLYTIVYKENPFYNVDEIMDHPLRIPFIMSKESIDLIKMMLTRDVTSRPTMEQVITHSWLQHRSW